MIDFDYTLTTVVLGGTLVGLLSGIFVVYAGWGGDGTTRNALGWALFDKTDPRRLLRRSSEPFLRSPKEHLFSDALVRFGGRWLLFYGYADERIERVELDVAALCRGQAKR